MIRAGKASLEAELAPIFERLRLGQQLLESTVAGLFAPRPRISNRLGKKPDPVHADPAKTSGGFRGKPASRQLELAR